MTASRRLQLAAESSGTIGIAVRRWRRPAEAADRIRHPLARHRPSGNSLAGTRRWPPLWQLELIRCRAGESADFEVEACDAKGRLALPSNLVDRPGQKDIGQRRASA
jgi:protein ImuA